MTTRMLRRSLAALLLLLLLVAMPMLTAAQNAPIELYRSEQFDYYFFYDATLWEILDQSSEPESELVRFSDGEAFADYWAFIAPDLTPVDCLNFVLDVLGDDPSIVEIAALSEEGGLPAIEDFGPVAIVDLVVTVDEGDGQSRFARHEQCEELDPGRSLLLQSSTVPAAAHNAGVGIPLPWIAGHKPVDESNGDENASVPIASGNGQVLGTLDPELGCTFVDQFYVVAVSAEAGDAFPLDASSFAAVLESGATVPAMFNGWHYPSVTSHSDFVLRPGEIGLFELEVAADAYDLYFVPSEGAPVLVDRRYPCGGGGGAPVLIDIE